jgi:hypothetical protein
MQDWTYQQEIEFREDVSLLLLQAFTGAALLVSVALIWASVG